MQTEILLIRHGQSKGNEENFFVGQLNSPLSELGKKQAKLLCEYLKTQNINAVYSSDLIRAENTVIEFSEYSGLPIKKDKRLRELCGGDWEGKTIPELLELYPEDYGKHWLSDAENAVIPNGESVEHAKQRAISVLTEIAKQNLGKRIAVACHAGLIRCFQCAVTNETWKNVSWVNNASVSEYVFQNGTFNLKRANINEHLGDFVSQMSKNI